MTNHAPSWSFLQVEMARPIRWMLSWQVAAAAAVRELLSQGVVPAPPNDERCRHCSLRESCLPRATGEPQRIAALQRDLFADNDAHMGEPPCTNS